MPSTISYTSREAAVAQVDHVTPGGTIAATDLFRIALGSKTLEVVATATTVAHIVALLKNAIDAAQATEPEWTRVTASDETTHLQVTSRTPGEPFTLTAAIVNTSGGTAPTLTPSTATASKGPRHYDHAANYSGGALPANGDTLIVEGGHSLAFGDLSAVTLAPFIVRDFGGQIGLPPVNQDGGYAEYRPQEMLISATIFDCMQNVVSQCLRINFGSAQVTGTVYSSGTPLERTLHAVTLRGSHASNVFTLLGGSVGIATEAGETATAATIRTGASISSGDSRPRSAKARRVTNFTMEGGNVRLYADSANVIVDGGTCQLIDDPDISGSCIIRESGTVEVNGAPTVAKFIVGSGGFLDLSKDARPFTVSACDLYAGGRIYDPFKRATWSTGIVLKQCGLEDVTLNIGNDRTVSIT